VIDRLQPPATRPRASPREDLLTVVFATWMVGGLFVDGWAHHRQKPESFFTPWHAILYSGFVAAAVWMTWMVQRRRAEGAQGLAAVPVGYGIGLVGAAVFAFGGLFDMGWHVVFGIEGSLEALLSPSHLVLLVGGLLVVTSPLRSAWHDPASSAPRFPQFLTPLLSATLATVSAAFYLMMLSPFLIASMTDAPYRFGARSVDVALGTRFAGQARLVGYAAILLTTVLLLAPGLLLMRRWRLPFGTFTFLFGGVATLTAALDGFLLGPIFLAPAVAGVGADLLYRRIRPGPDRPWAMRLWAAATPVVMWLAYFAILKRARTLEWSVELWAGVTLMSALVGFGLALCMTPPPVPAAPVPVPAEDG
jgi:hypothetical protein